MIPPAFVVTVVFAALLGGFLFRVRGGLGADWIRARIWSGYGTQGGRAVFAAPMALLAMAVAWDWRLVALAPAIFLGLVKGWMEASDVGRDGDRSRLVEFLIMTARGVLLTGPPGLVLWWFGYGWHFALAGLYLGALYEAGHRTPTWRKGFARGQEIAEVYVGIWLGIHLVLTVGWGIWG